MRKSNFIFEQLADIAWQTKYINQRSINVLVS